ncbi:flagella biosynthesis regulatory protein FliT [Citrobacter amalonaticus]|uniref:flagella biosynthesis regulatory protein FliT n=1 Tax=Citrobacter amalonaticus TaxID=35703 RepID=UPI001A24DC38|nr:flagella biosynthesis regulatory protein FliT [Citrobacter amalonaticus]MDL4619003.1 flagella biosynthesis regulatory protein FliT [Citrobacter amalonaticus]MDL4623101.1 flagella biosynthesis regulatory protein FliT [Citrobacter amalonaticus]HAT6804461.1 flagella biosynthesis regulatory protein FliT [Citrobacter freundii]HDZ8011199.1 flagella biosynthesis regulatory protein FliT [Citrobacter amalonaticus]
MSASFSSLQQWLLLRSVSQQMLRLASENKWDELVEGEMEYIRLVETLAQDPNPPGDPSTQSQIRELLHTIIDNENEVKRLLSIRMDELKVLIQNGNQQKTLTSTYSNLSGMLLVPDAPTAPQ